MEASHSAIVFCYKGQQVIFKIISSMSMVDVCENARRRFNLRDAEFRNDTGILISTDMTVGDFVQFVGPAVYISGTENL
jgi:peroxiredoxin